MSTSTSTPPDKSQACYVYDYTYEYKYDYEYLNSDYRPNPTEKNCVLGGMIRRGRLAAETFFNSRGSSYTRPTWYSVKTTVEGLARKTTDGSSLLNKTKGQKPLFCSCSTLTMSLVNYLITKLPSYYPKASQLM